MLASFQGSLKLAEHINLLMKKVQCIRFTTNICCFMAVFLLNPSGEFQPLMIHQAHYVGRELLDFFEYHIRQAAKNKGNRQMIFRQT